jgi:general secretion pathway protein J
MEHIAPRVEAATRRTPLMCRDTHRARRRATRQDGFTLLEILVAMALLSGIMLALGASMRTLAMSQERIDARLEATDDLRAANTLLRATLERVSVREPQGVRAAGSSRYLFQPSEQGLAWVGVMPARYGAGGRYFFRLAVEPVADSASLVLRFAPWTDSPGFPDWSQAEGRALAHGVTAFAIAFADERAPETGWSREWTVPDRLPSRVLLTVQTQAETWAPLIVALRPMRSPNGGSGRFSIGGSSR